MLGATDKFSLYEKTKQILIDQGIKVNPYREINYGLQFLVFKDKLSGIIRIYDGKKGLRFDFSQLKSEEFSQYIQALLVEEPVREAFSELFTTKEKDMEKLHFKDKDPDDIIGIDESGKGDYFGPLVVAAVRVTPELKTSLDSLGIDDSKKLSPRSISYLAQQIKKRCQHAVLLIGNQSYNEVYSKFNNLNHMLAWGHMKVLEDTLKQGYCANALSDQFADPSLLKNSLRAKDLNITLYQRPRAETNIAVACASILARDSFVTELDRMSKFYKIELPKGSTKNSLETAIKFVNEVGKKELHNVAKLHFNVTQQMENQLKPNI